MKHAREIVVYQLKGGIAEADFLQAAAEMEEHFARKQRDFLKRTFAKAEGNRWVDVIYWESLDDAMKASEAAMTSPAGAPIFAMIDDASTNMSHFEIVS
jgi:inorganic pyrophosphatase